MKTPRVFQLTALAMVVVSAVQVGWWLLDQHSQTADKVRADARTPTPRSRPPRRRCSMPARRRRACSSCCPTSRVSDGRAALDPQREQALLTEARHRDRQYAWEGGFFLFALGLCIAVIARALRAEARVLEEQDNFLALVSHQFKTPLASLQLSLETMALRAPGAAGGAHPHRPHAGGPGAHGARWSRRSSRACAWSAAAWNSRPSRSSSGAAWRAW